MRSIELCAALAIVAPCLAGIADAAPHGKGVNYLTGEGMNQLNCDASNVAQIAKDMAEMQSIGVQWVRIETAETAVSGLPNPPACPPPAHEFDNLDNLLAGIASIGATPIVNILAWHYTPAMTAKYNAWLEAMLAAAPSASVFEMADEENLSNRVQSYPGANPNEEPYGWDFDPKDFAPDDGVGQCPTTLAKRDDLVAAVKSYVAWLADSYAVIKAHNPHAVVMLGGLSSWDPKCWLLKLGNQRADRYANAIGYHPYPRYDVTPEDAVGTLSDLKDATQRWERRLPIWITEFGFTTNSAYGAGTVPSETVKAQDIAREFQLLHQRLSGPMLVYTARDSALTSAEWAQQCPGTSCPGGIGGAGLFEWEDGNLIVEPAATAFANAQP